MIMQASLDRAEQLGRMPPHSAMAERSVIGSLLKEPSHIPDVAAILRKESFYQDAHQKVFSAITDLWNDQKPVDIVSVADALYELKQIEDVGGYPYLAELVTDIGTASNVLHYVEIVLDNWKRREVISIASKMMTEAYDGADETDSVISTAEREIIAVSEQGVSANEVDWLRESTDPWLDEIDEIAERRRNGVLEGVPTGFADLDKKLGGLKCGELTILAARPSIGKTALALSIAYKAATVAKVPVAFFSLEQRATELKKRLVSAFGGVDGIRLRDGNMNQEDTRRLAVIAAEFRQTDLFIIDKFSQSILTIAAIARRLKRRYGIKLVVIDYLQLVTPENRKAPRQEQVASMSRRLKGLARELDMPVLCLAQINRLSEARTDGKPKMSDLRESGAIEQDADAVILLHRVGEKESKNGDPQVQLAGQEIQVLIEKNRNGPTGKVLLLYRPALMRFENMAFDGYHN